MFFEKETNKKVIGTFLSKSKSLHVVDDFRKERLKISADILEYAYNDPKGWDSRCQFNIKYVGDQFLKWIGSFDESKPNTRE